MAKAPNFGTQTVRCVCSLILLPPQLSVRGEVVAQLPARHSLLLCRQGSFVCAARAVSIAFPLLLLILYNGTEALGRRLPACPSCRGPSIPRRVRDKGRPALVTEPLMTRWSGVGLSDTNAKGYSRIRIEGSVAQVFVAHTTATTTTSGYRKVQVKLLVPLRPEPAGRC